MKVDFETKCWEGDWEYILKTNRLQKMIEINDYEFTKKTLLINNINSFKEVKKFADKKVRENIIDQFIFVKDFENEVLELFEIPKSFKKDKGFKYSISELTGIYLSNSDYLVHFSSDSILINKTNWIEKSIDLIKNNSRIKAVSPVEERSRQKKILIINNGYEFTHVFSDQCYLIPISHYKNNIYEELNVNTYIYPKYGGNLFEKRICAHFYNHSYFRVILGEVLFYSMNFKNLKYIKNILIFLGKDFSLIFSFIADLRRMVRNDL